MECSICGQPPDSCYNLCPNSPHFYSPEQERLDDAHYGDDDNRERYAATVADADLFFMTDAD